MTTRQTSKIQTLATLLMIAAAAIFSNDNKVQGAALNLSSGAITIDTDALTITGSATASGVDLGGIATFEFDSISLTGGGATTVTLVGSRPLSLRSTDDITIGTALNLSGNNATGLPGATGVLGGFAGGDNNGVGVASDPGLGPGAGGGQNPGAGHGGGGAGFGGAGGSAASGGTAGVVYGDGQLTTLQGGSGGGGGGTCCVDVSGGGAGGGAIELFSQFGSVTITSDGSIEADGGATTNNRSGGGGSGGGIRIDAGTGIVVQSGGVLSVAGGDTAGTIRSGGGGGGGRIALLGPSLVLDVTSQIPGVLTSGSFLNADPGLSGGIIGQPSGQGGFDGVVGHIEFFQQELREPIVPEPSSVLLLGLGALGLVRHTRRRRRRATH